MKNRIQLYLILILASVNCIAQEKVKLFELTLREPKSINSLYGSVKLLDSREDTANFGLVRLGILNKEAAVLPARPIDAQLNEIVATANGTLSPKGELLFQLRRLKFIEKAEGDKEFGYCFFRANILTGSEGQFKLVSSIDTFLVVESGDVTKLILEKANNTIVKFITNALVMDAEKAPVLSYTEVMKIDSIEKLKIKVYTAAEYVNGVYCTFEAFKEQQPDFTLFSITFEDGEITEVKAKNEYGRIKKIKSDHVYAIVNKGTPYISAQFGFYPLVKNNNDFYFIGDDKINYIKGQIVKSNSIFNNTEYVYSPLPLTSVYEIKIDHVNGKFMRVKEIK